ncbi:MAG: efflux transporter periplasmic adaptor subunit, partial [Myxococcota bacterium]|nr:efflux transporter periplasmic adaptor subunit [Myxococcota bacterium]
MSANPSRGREIAALASFPRRTAAVVALLLAACGPAEEPPAPEIRPVRAIVVEEMAGGETVTLTGRIEAQEEVRLAFRLGQRMVERKVNVGDRVVAGQLVATLEATTFDNAVQAARANLAAAQASATDARLELDRQQALLDRGVAPRVRVARQRGRDAVFDVPARVKEAAAGMDPEVAVTLTSDAQVRANGRVREVSPQADPVTRTFEVRVGLTDPPESMRLGTTVNGTIHLGAKPGIAIPASALTSANGAPAVWIVDAA